MQVTQKQAASPIWPKVLWFSDLWHRFPLTKADLAAANLPGIKIKADP